MVRRLYKHKLLLDVVFPPRSYFPMLNHRFDVKHVKTDLKYIGLPDEKVYALAAQLKRCHPEFWLFRICSAQQ